MNRYFQLTRKDKIGIAVVSTVILFLVVLLNVNQHRGLGEPTAVNIDSIPLNPGNNDFSLTKNNQKDVETKQDNNVRLSPFYPNKINLEEWESLGFSQKQAASIVNYREKYGPFTSAEDVCHLYVVSDKKCKELSPLMQFDTEEMDTVATQVSVAINSASAEELKQLKWIGDTYAKRIVDYRNSLGGFFSKAQYSEVYGLSEEALNALNENTSIDVSSIKKIPINTASKEQIKKHPYLRGWAVVTEILQQREKQALQDLEFLRTKKLISEEEKEKIIPYIDFK
ncbi:MAG: helix-hairpin-helix domain-containing protein [Crocinitomicaceae bacterium]